MTTRSTTKPRRKLIAWTVTAVLVLGLAGCERAGARPDSVSATAAPKGGASPHPQHTRRPAPLAVLQGPDGLTLTLTAAIRDPGGFLTIRGTLHNSTDETVTVPAGLRGNETAVLKNGHSLAGATLVDFTGRTRYYVLRDTDGRPLTTTGLTRLAAGEKVRVFMQFPAPPAGTTTVGFQLPQFDTATIPLPR
ncbi:hypothetical protein [Streptomyces sp. NPDC127197]|uniref:hypothetical protein n=1 Tax=Streptomyces sp. NPDC127197 TaxID=3345388 RepID=UPI00363C94EF